jgi:hypothetical protein
MPYQYGMQTSPSGGNGLGGLPKKQTTPARSNFTRIVTAGSGVIVPPQNAKYMRVAAVGPGGGAVSSGGIITGGGGGGCAATKIIPVAVINYRVGAGGVSGSVIQNTTATFNGYVLLAEGGKTVGSGSQSGFARGGDFNFQGGVATSMSDGEISSGGGAAGPNGDGGNGVGTTSTNTPANPGQLAGTGWGVGGGSGGASLTSQSGGAGSGAMTIRLNNLSSVTAVIVAGGVMFGMPPLDRAGGEMGGGGSAIGFGLGNGGVGGIVVEWFYD